MKKILISVRSKWKDIVGYENEYQINQFGEIRTLKDSPKLKKYDVLKPQISKKTVMSIKCFIKMVKKNF